MRMLYVFILFPFVHSDLYEQQQFCGQSRDEDSCVKKGCHFTGQICDVKRCSIRAQCDGFSASACCDSPQRSSGFCLSQPGCFSSYKDNRDDRLEVTTTHGRFRPKIEVIGKFLHLNNIHMRRTSEHRESSSSDPESTTEEFIALEHIISISPRKVRTARSSDRKFHGQPRSEFGDLSITLVLRDGIRIEIEKLGSDWHEIMWTIVNLMKD